MVGEQIKMMLQATDGIPMNIGFLGKGNTSKPQGLKEVHSLAGCMTNIFLLWVFRCLFSLFY